MKANKNFINIQLHAQKPTDEQIAAAVVASGATAEQGAASAKSISAMLATNPQGNDFLPEFNNKIRQVYNDTHSDQTLYDRFRKFTDAPTVQAVVYEHLTPVDFNFNTDPSTLPANEQCNARKIPKIHSVLRSLSVQQRFSTFASKHELDKIQDGQAVSVDDIVANLGASYADTRTTDFETLVDGILSAKSGDQINAMATTQDLSNFIQQVRIYARLFKKKRTDQYNAFTIAGDATAKADTKMYIDEKPIVLIDPSKLYKIDADYYATLFQLTAALPDVDFVPVDGFTKNKFAILIDPRVIAWFTYDKQFKSEDICGQRESDRRYLLFVEEIFGEFTCFNRMIFRTAAANA